ncbi:MAG TPA: FAD/NAD(P)-binding oxidoreductase [Bryobacteraceae bacterium]|nr:FAD/NAD(P)-binding oxidoreductase [Bryobacteraceae bacterium]
MPREERCHILIVGAGPAGIAAACAAAETCENVIVLDDNPAPGGQIWRGEENRWIGRLRASRARVCGGTRAVAPLGDGALLAEQQNEPVLFYYEKLILATGARELFLPIPGWTLPGVTGAGGLQALVHGGLPIIGKRVVVAGSGPLLLAVAAHLRGRGALISAIAEQAPMVRLTCFATQLWRAPGRIAQASGLAWTLRGVPRLTSSWPIAVLGDTRLKAVRLHAPKGDREIPCDYLACGFGLIPNTEFAALAGCQIHAGFVAVDESQRTTRDGVLCAGEPTGIGGVDRSLLEGRIAGYTAACRRDDARRLFPARRRAHAFATELARAFALRDELKTLAQSDTIVCRCEDVTLARAIEHDTTRAARLHARCGMGACQGRVCGPALQFITGRADATTHARPPIFPVGMSTLAAAHEENPERV